MKKQILRNCVMNLRSISLFFLIILSFLLVSTNIVQASIVSTDDLKPLEHIIKQADKDTLIIFDIDHVLIMPTNEYTLNRHPFRKALWKEIESRHSKEEMKYFYGITASKSRWRMVDPEIFPIFIDITKRQIPSIALSSIYTGKFGNIEKLEDWRIQHLKDIGFDFSKLSPIKDTFYIKKLEKHDGVPVLKSGVILTAQVDKAVVLDCVLNYYNYFPKRIIFVDDQLHNLKSIEKMCSKLHIKFYGIHYTAVSKMPIPVIDEKLEKLRFEILEKEHVWLSYKEIKDIKKQRIIKLVYNQY